MWRIDFADAENSSAYVSADTARFLVMRGDTWRTWDFFWMLHNMDYMERKSFNHPLIIFVAFGTLWLAATGFYLLFKSFTRTDFRWLRRRKKPVVRSEEHTSELQSLMRISYAVFCLNKRKKDISKLL